MMEEIEKQFELEYLATLNAAEAARRCGYPDDNGQARKMGYYLLNRPHVREAIKKELEKRLRKAELNADKVLDEISNLAFYDPADYRGVQTPDDLEILPPHVRKAVVGWSWDREGNLTLKLSPKTPSLEQLGRYFKLFTDKIEMSGSLELARRLKEARERRLR